MRLAALGLLMILSACATGRDVARSADCPAETFTIYFALDATTLDPIAGEVLDIAAARVVGCPGRLEVAGYADPSGDAVINERLSAERARAVLEGLLARGVIAERVRVVAFGEAGAVTSEGLTEPMRRRAEVRFIPAGS